jgi:outer membrane protein assembly factor BamA
VAGNNVQIDNFYDRIFIDQAQAIIYYPFSTSQRLELQGGVTHYSFDREIHRAIFNQFGQQVTQVEVVDTTAPSPLTFFETSLAYVGDNSFFGFTSPVSGKRFRLEVSPTIGTLSYQTLLADYRSYHFNRPFTFAFRGLHYGRYGSNSDGFADDGTRVLSPLFVGWETFVRGYAQESFTSAECRPDTSDLESLACPAFDRLIGSRIALASIELRVPLIGVEEFGLINFPFLPTELAPFIDAGLAWSTGDDVDFSFARQTTSRVPVFSAGISARMNILGFMVFETYYAYPFQRPDKGGHFGFQIAPGW